MTLPGLPALRLGLVAGEASGDLIGAMLVQGLQARRPVEVAGIGGPKLVAQGMAAWWPSERLSVFGFADAMKRLPELLWIRHRLGSRLLRERPDVFVGVDAPDFNFGLERRLRAKGLGTVHYVCPSIWAWRPERIGTIRAAADHVLCLFPFEPAILEAGGVPATFVGHPLASLIPANPDRSAARRQLGLDDGVRVVALLPGSRQSEMALIGPAMLGAARLLAQRDPSLRFVLPCAPGLRAALNGLLAPAQPLPQLQVLDGQSHEALAACDVTLVASGTATLEAMLFKRPMVIAYRLSPGNFKRMKRLQLQPWVGLPNVLAREFLVPECLQNDCTPERLAAQAQAWLDDPTRCSAVQARFAAIHETLRADTAQRCHDAIAQVAGR